MDILGLIAVLSFGLPALESDTLLVKIVTRRRNSCQICSYRRMCFKEN